ncbi:MAG: hypothetical protein KKA05_08370 [Alphaproteobacteria bacterium]|nr:hypothetical protein [Alphaproteobacteria bacterium]MBU0859462.1 hypothetical protein [Alphaproteobacteria bacterium]
MSEYQEPSRFAKAADQLGQAWDVATTGKYRTHSTPMSWDNRISHIGHRLTDALCALFEGRTRAEAMHDDMFRDLMTVEQEMKEIEAVNIGRGEVIKHKPPGGPGSAV